jgi:plasmid stabilization system protein ParE
VRLVWSQLAAGQVDQALAYIVADDAAAAGRWLEELLERVEALRRFPDAGRVVPELGRKEIRELLIGSYRVIYRRSEASVEIVVVRHQARHFDDDELARECGSNKRIEQNARRSAARRQASRVCSCAVRWTDPRRSGGLPLFTLDVNHA